MKKVIVIGSGASGVHFALTLLRKGHEVVMLDVGHEKSAHIRPGRSLNDLKAELDDPVEYFLGERFEAVTHSGSNKAYFARYYGFPPSKSSIFAIPAEFKYRANGFQPFFSFAQGGLAEAWTGGVYPFNDHELKEFPFSYREIKPAYAEVAGRMGISATDDDLTRFFPLHDNLLESLEMDQHSQEIVQAYQEQKERINSNLGAYLGRSRVATLSRDHGKRNGCVYCGRCLWGCPTEALYTPSITLRECRQFPNFTYIPQVFVTHYQYTPSGQINAVVGYSLKDNAKLKFSADNYVLAAGTLSSSYIYLNSIYKAEGRRARLIGLMDNRQILVPFINLRMIGKRYDPQSYQYHQLAIGISAENREEYLHGQITTLKTAMAHPIIQNLPFDLKMSVFLFRNLRSSLGIINLNLHDRRREDSYVTLEDIDGDERPGLSIHYSPPGHEKTTIRQAISKVRKILWKLGCIVPPGMVHVRSMGASVHYSGTLPMSTNRAPFTTTPYCRSHDFGNLHIVDGTTFPFLPAKNLTFTMMANAVRVAEHEF